MNICWSNIVEELFRKIQDLIIICPSCSTDTACIDEISKSTPIDIKMLSGCCSCLLENILDPIYHINRFYSSSETDEDVVIYVLGDVIIEISQLSALVVPLSRLENYLEILEEMDYRHTETIKKWLINIAKTINCVEKP